MDSAALSDGELPRTCLNLLDQQHGARRAVTEVMYPANRPVTKSDRIASDALNGGILTEMLRLMKRRGKLVMRYG